MIMFYLRTQRQPEPKKIIPKYSFGKKGEKEGEFSSIGNLIIKDNFLFVTDQGNRIQTLKINSDGNLTFLSSFGKKGEFEIMDFFAKDSLLILTEYHIKGELLGPEECILVNNRIQTLKINPNGTLISTSTFGRKGRGRGRFYAIGSVKAKGNHLFITEYNFLEQLGGKTGNHRIQILKIDPNGKISPVLVFGKKGERLGEFYFPTDLAIKDNYLYVADWGNFRIQVLEIKY